MSWFAASKHGRKDGGRAPRMQLAGPPVVLAHKFQDFMCWDEEDDINAEYQVMELTKTEIVTASNDFFTTDKRALFKKFYDMQRSDANDTSWRGVKQWR